jgi:hypothetical protein
MHFTPKVNAFVESCKEVLLPSIHPVGVIQNNTEDTFVKCAGSSLLLENDGNCLFITNAHVAKKLLNRDKGSSWVQIGDLRFEPESRLVFNDLSIDVAGFSVKKSEIEIIAAGARPWSADYRGDAQQAQSFPCVILYGFPGIFRVREGTTTEAQGILHGLNVSDVSASGQLILKFDPDEFVTPMSKKETESYAKEPGGISGAPVFGWHDAPSFVWIGTVVELSSSLGILRVVPSKQNFDAYRRECPSHFR